MMVRKISTNAMSLSGLLDGMAKVTAKDDCYPSGIKSDSRLVETGDLFLACSGNRHHGIDFIDQAVAAGACAVIHDGKVTARRSIISVPLLAVSNLKEKAGEIAARFYGRPSAYMNLIGVTGTNGKTSVAHISAQLLHGFEAKRAGIIGTMGIGVPGKMEAGLNTTPDPLSIQSALADFLDKGIQNVVMEVSSHGLDQYRVTGVDFDIGVFTNLSREHLDYHGDMASYAAAKRRLFSVASMHSAVINVDDDYGQELSLQLKDRLHVYNYGFGQHGYAEGIDLHINGNILTASVGSLTIEVDSVWGKGRINSQLTGRFNAANLLACLSVACLSGLEFQQVLDRMKMLRPIPGRMECFTSQEGLRVIVDYAHTPDALEKSLRALREFDFGELICVAGCGGDRDAGKRPLMGKIAEQYADKLTFTNDNPRFEDPGRIISDMLSGTLRSEAVRVQPDRRLAIEEAVASAGKNDVVLIAGKGHETYQEVKGARTPFSDRQMVRNLLGLQE